jgi:hypothetical protein
MVKAVSPFVAVCFLSLQLAVVLPPAAHAGAADDLKQIEYKHYFRGNYTKAIAELKSFLARDNLAPEVIVEAREYLAASLVMTGSTEEAKAQYMTLLNMDASYAGPDPSVFKSIVVSTYNEAKAEYASAVIRNVPDTALSDAAAGSAATEQLGGKPFYKKWWFYATMGAVLLLVVGAAGGGGDDGGGTTESGRIVVEVDAP